LSKGGIGCILEKEAVIIFTCALYLIEASRGNSFIFIKNEHIVISRAAGNIGNVFFKHRSLLQIYSTSMIAYLTFYVNTIQKSLDIQEFLNILVYVHMLKI
jgi:hypothetical protein